MSYLDFVVSLVQSAWSNLFYTLGFHVACTKITKGLELSLGMFVWEEVVGELLNS